MTKSKETFKKAVYPSKDPQTSNSKCLIDWSKSTIRHPYTRNQRELELQEWLAEDYKYELENNCPPLTEGQKKRRLDFYTAMLIENPIDWPLPVILKFDFMPNPSVDDFDYTDEELKQCCLQFPVTVEIRGDLLNRFTIQFLDRHQPDVPYNQVEPRYFEKIEKNLRHNWRRHQAKIDRFRTTDEYLKAVKMYRARFHRYVRRKWVEKQREMSANLEACSEESISLFGSFENTVILSQPHTEPGHTAAASQGIGHCDLHDSYSAFSQHIGTYNKSTQL